MYAHFKSLVFGMVPTGWDAAQILLGFAVFLITLVVFRRSVRTWWAFWPVLIVGLAVEAADMALLGQDPARAVRDVVLFALLPLLTTFVFRLGWVK